MYAHLFHIYYACVRFVEFDMMFLGDFPCFGFRFVDVFYFVCFVGVVLVMFLCVIYVLLLY